jgi:branched-chain amino acid aminotransferase
VPWRRNEFSPLSGVKTTSYAENAVALAWAQDRSATEALFLNTGGDLCEGAVSNLFLVHQGTLLTPSLRSGCLPGITRSLIIDLCPQLDVPCLEKALTPADLAAASEVFLTNSLKGIFPVETCDNRPLSAPGPLTTRLREALQDLRGRLPDP